MSGAARTTGVVVALGTAQTLAWASTYYLPAILAVPMARDLGVPPSWVFGAFSVGLVVSALLGPAAGRAIDARGGRPVLVLSSLVFSGGLALLAVANGVTLSVLGWIVLGAGMAFGLYDAAFSTLAHLYGRDARGPITGISLIAGFASTVGWPLSALSEAELGWRGACLAWASLHLFTGLPTNRFLIPAAASAARDLPEVSSAEAGISGPSARRAMALLAFVFAVTWFVSTAMAAHLPRLLEAAGASSAAAVAAGALIGPAQVGARLLEFGFLLRYHPLVSARLAALAHPLGAATLLTFGGPAAAAFTLLHGAGNGVLTIAKGTLPLAIFGPAGYGLRQGILGAPSRLLQAGAPLAFGLVIDAYGALAALALSTSVSLAAFVALLSLRLDSEPTTTRT
ncbi:MFS transporter [Bosea sp. AS-1]|uniref:MFS transporter n=1 Tax=Bosea sp. AS-1 TaxID=2015316 RepID=UPI000B76D011|nr:MFS transporter [Bosea sp. AS-1]